MEQKEQNVSSVDRPADNSDKPEANILKPESPISSIEPAVTPVPRGQESDGEVEDLDLSTGSALETTEASLLASQSEDEARTAAVSTLGGVDSDNEFADPKPSSNVQQTDDGDVSDDDAFVEDPRFKQIEESLAIKPKKIGYLSDDDEVDDSIFSAEKGLYSLSGIVMTHDPQESKSADSTEAHHNDDIQYNEIQPALALPTHKKFKLAQYVFMPEDNTSFDTEELEKMKRVVSPEPETHDVIVPKLGKGGTGRGAEVVERPDPEKIGRMVFTDDDDDDDPDFDMEDYSSDGDSSGSKSDPDTANPEKPGKPDKVQPPKKQPTTDVNNPMFQISLNRNPDDINPLDADKDLERGPETFLDKVEDKFWDFGDWLAGHCEMLGGWFYSIAGITEGKDDNRKRWVGMTIICVIFFMLLLTVVIVSVI